MVYLQVIKISHGICLKMNVRFNHYINFILLSWPPFQALSLSFCAHFCLFVFHIQTIFYFLESTWGTHHCCGVQNCDREVSLELSQENKVNICPDLPLSCIHIFEGLQVNMEAEERIIGGLRNQLEWA